jgi:putative phage-type endonuclease
MDTAELAAPARRKKGIGGSDSAAALGQSRYKTAFQLYQEKLGLIDPETMFDAEARERMKFGQLIEQVIADMFAQRYGVKLRRHNRIAHHPHFDWMLASYDRTIDGRREGLECKNVDSMGYRLGEWGEPGSDQVPTEYFLQCAHYLATSGYDVWHLAACVGGNKLMCYVIERDAEMIEMIEEGEHEFWQHVQREEPVTLDYQHVSAIPLLKKMYPGSSGETVRLPPEAEALHYARLDFEEQEKLMKAGSDAARARLMHMMGDAALGLLPNGGGYTRKLVERKGYAVDPMKYIDFRFSAKKGGSNE